MLGELKVVGLEGRSRFEGQFERQKQGFGTACHWGFRKGNGRGYW